MKLLSVLAAGALALAATASTLAGQPDDKHCAARAIPVLEFAGGTLRSVTTPKGKTTFRYEHGFLKQIRSRTAVPPRMPTAPTDALPWSRSRTAKPSCPSTTPRAA